VSAPRRRKAANPNSNRQANGQGNRQAARQGARRRPATGSDFWGSDEIDEVPAQITPSDVPAAMITSLGPPPIPGHEAAAQHYFEAVYPKAVALATALAAASGLLHFDDQDDEPAVP